MRITDVPLAVLRLQYRLARIPLSFFEDRVVSRMEPEAPGRIFYERSIGAVDAVVGGVLQDGESKRRGAAMVQRSEARGEAVRLDAEAAAAQAAADDDLARRREQAAAAPANAHEAARKRVQGVEKAAAGAKHDVAQRATKRTDAAKRRVDAAAEREIDAAEEAKDTADEAISRREDIRVEAAEARLEEATETRTEAVEQRVHADRVDQLVEQKKNARRNGS